jgi:hypothetical protein
MLLIKIPPQPEKEEAAGVCFKLFRGGTYLAPLIAACAAARRAIGTLNGEQLTYVSPVL